MKICIIGLGSIGKRHLRNLVTIMSQRGWKYQIDALRCSQKVLTEDVYELIDQQYYSFEELPDDYDIIFVTNPTVFHYDTIQKTVHKTRNMFIEKPVFDSLDYDLEMLSLCDKSVYYVACPLRHKNILKYIKQKVISKEKIISSRIISTSSLPTWRKNQDYRQSYSAQKIMGGGVTKDLIHEWDYAVYLFGNPLEVMHMKGHLSDLEIDSDDVSIYIARFQNMLLEMHLDYIGCKTERILQMFGSHKRIDVNLLSNTMYEYRNDELVKERVFPTEDCYYNEMEYFLDCIEGKKENINSITTACNTLKIALV